MTPLDPTLQEELSAAAERAGCELIHVNQRGDTLQLILDHPEGITLEHCEAVSRDASAILDVEDYGGTRYVLEVSSPGLDRELYRAADYTRFQGHKIRVTFTLPEGHKQTRIGTLEAFDPASEQVTFTDSQTDETLQIPLGHIKTTRLEVEL